MAAERSLTLSTKRYQEGYSDFQRVLTAQRAYGASLRSDPMTAPDGRASAAMPRALLPAPQSVIFISKSPGNMFLFHNSSLVRLGPFMDMFSY